MPIYINPDISREQQRICNCKNIYVQKQKKTNTHSLTLIIVIFFAEYKSAISKKAFSFYEHFP